MWYGFGSACTREQRPDFDVPITKQPGYIAKTVQLKDQGVSKTEEDRELEAVIRKLHGVSCAI
jgi:hypothetical protein